MYNFCLKQQVSVWRSSLKCPPPGSPQAHSALEQSLMRVAIVMDCHGIDMKLNPKRTSCYRLIILSRNFS